jgi:ribosomal subunit interface protein
MKLIVTGKNIDLGESLRDYASGRIEQAVEKYFSRPVSGQMFIEKAHGEFLCTCSLHLHSGFDVQTSGRAHDAYACVDDAAEKLEKQVRRYKRRLKNHHAELRHDDQFIGGPAIDYVLESRNEDEGGETENADGLAPPIIAENPTTVMKLTVSDAVMRMDLSNQPFLIFRNRSHDRINVVYRRPDGNIGWIDPVGVSETKD